ncbi:mediator of RNA polymerase II transcription subunit 13-like isoform X2 [Lingula anatina]|uniref:Mediator of RNA polymerase II transcription subunit 13 n=1 Tax=Lingula anatina TaxID=7574 RepID=A0A1S3K2V1_LINAN|nr:mediator of RNA polymerase II transcription subunit 13-like isoform X2 [Lingula anatina]|eukprot:XP_013416581.1 mediator of RNA polymerase II transcription subunit 13-like isoform X2 [Lingula anatina]
MSHPNPTGNGCSLEDCHTNLFALTDLAGIKWRRLTHGNVFCIDPLDDPILLAFTKCIQADILCVWRRVHKASEQRINNDYLSKKELWVFWYGDEPADLKSILSTDLLAEEEAGCWDTGLSYECRTLLFRALHNLIERCLLSHNFVRLGKWFVLPLEYGSNSSDKSDHLSFSFSFFLHGESTVCASVDVRQQPAVWRPTLQHLTLAQNAQNGMPVLLAPYGLAGTLTGHSYKDADQDTRKLVEEWQQFYPLCSDSKEGAGSYQSKQMPQVVEVVVGGVRMRYPSRYVLMTELDNMRSRTICGTGQGRGDANRTSGLPLHTASALLSPPTSPASGQVIGDTCLKGLPLTSLDEGKRLGSQFTETLSDLIVERVWQESCLAVPSSKRSVGNENGIEENTVGNWDFVDPVQKAHCSCTKLKGNKQRLGFGQNKSGLPGGKEKRGDKLEKTEKEKSRLSRGMTPFHRRSPLSDDLLTQDLDIMIQRGSGGLQGTGNGADYPFSGYKSQPGSNLPQFRTPNFEQGGMGIPRSDAPSPLVATHSQPCEGGQSSDPTMPTLSPHPPPKIQDKDHVSSANTVPQESCNLPSQETTATANCNDGFTAGKMNGLPPKGNNFMPPYHRHMPEPKVEYPHSKSWLDAQRHKLEGQGVKRPMLPCKFYDREEMQESGELLYDFGLLNAWLSHPVKKFRGDGDPDSPPMVKPEPRHPHGYGHPQVSPKQHSQTSSGPPVDPYEFSDESSSNAGSFRPRSLRNSRDEFSRPSPFSRQMEEESRESAAGRGSDSKEDRHGHGDMGPIGSPLTPGGSGPMSSASLMRESDIRPSMNDLQNIFDTSDDDSNDDAFQPPSPPPSNKPEETTIKSAKTTLVNSGGSGAIDTTQLSRMFPTPPSQENNMAHSPCTGTDVHTDPSSVLDSRVDHFAQMSPSHENRDWSFVFRPPPSAKFVGSDKYGPIDLPSAKMSPVHVPVELAYRPSWQFPIPVIEKHHPPANQILPGVPVAESTPVRGLGEKPHPSPATFTGTSPGSAGYIGHSPAAYPGPGTSPAAFTGSMPGASPAAFHGMVQQRTPASYDLQSPASNASSYLNKNLSSVDNQGTNLQMPEAHGLVLNIVLSETLLNLFKDHNYDSCNICVCQGNIKGSDVGLYLDDPTNEPQYRCTCGFSAVRNRICGQNSGLFYEDELEITGIPHDHYERRKPSLLAIEPKKDENGVSKTGSSTLSSDIPQDLLLLLQETFSFFFPASAFRIYNQLGSLGGAPLDTPLMEIKDGCDACYTALEQGRQATDNCSSQKLEESVVKASCLHKWPYTHRGAILPTNPQDVVRLLKSLQPLLQDAIQKKRTTRLWEQVYQISGPLSWKDFHLLAGRGSDEAHEPQPIPSLLVGYDRDWLSQSPLAIKFWDKLLLEPYCKPRDIAYVVVAPENDFVLNYVRNFFKDLSTMYELCRLGRHSPIDKVLRDGIMRVGKTAARKLAEEPVDAWFTQIGDSVVASKLKLYAQVCKHHLAPFLSQTPLDKMFSPGGGRSTYKSAAHSAPSPAHTPDGQGAATPNHNDDKDRDFGSEASGHGSHGDGDHDEASEVPALMVYIVDPFTQGQQWEGISRLSMMGLLRCYQELINNLPESLQNNVHLQILPLQTILDRSGDCNHMQHMKSMAFSIFSQCRQALTHTVVGRTLTGFGPAAAAEAICKRSMDKMKIQNKLYSPPYVLAPMKDKQSQLAETCGEVRERSAKFFCGYCLSEDQRWLLAVCTDDRGDLMETCTINIEIPNRNRRKKASARKIGLQKLWDFILSVISTTTLPWRLVIGRFGRLGHGELKGWSGLLSRKSLLRASKQMRDICDQCSVLSNNDYPCILSACLVSMETQSTFLVLPDSVKPEEKRASNAPLDTPHDASVTHILVFPTSSTAQPNTSAQTNEHDLAAQLGTDLGDDDPLFAGLSEDLNIDQDLNSFFGLADSPNQSPVGSPKADGPGSPGMGVGGRQSPSHYTPGGKTNRGASISLDLQEEANLLQQPLAMGYYLSTAKTGPLPKWFWSSCPHKENVCPVTFKAALHVHVPMVQQNQDELFHTNMNKLSHPLDSNATCDVLRYVLETYNALSWLTIDPAKNDRRTCLPIHFAILMQIYQAMNVFL